MSKRRTRTEFEESAGLNNLTWIQYRDHLKELAISMFEWRNLPDTVDERYIELTLFEKGWAVYFKDEVIGDLVLPVTNQGPLDVYGIPTVRRAYAVNGYQKMVDASNSVIIYNNMIHKNSILDMNMYARRLYNLDRIIDINANSQKTPILLQCDEQQRMTLINLYKEYDGNAPVIHGTKNLDYKGAFQVLSTNSPYVADKIFALKNQTWNEALTRLGISNVAFQKKERLVSDEVIRGQGGTIASRYSRLNERRKAVDAINKMFGTDIEVNFREDYRQTDDENMIMSPTEDQDKGIESMAVDLRTR